MFSRARSSRRRRSRESGARHPCQHEKPESFSDDGVDESQPHCPESPSAHDNEKPRLHKSAKKTTSLKDTITDRRPNFAATPKHQTTGREDRSTMSFQVNWSGLEALIHEFENPTQGREKPRSSGKSQKPWVQHQKHERGTPGETKLETQFAEDTKHHMDQDTAGVKKILKGIEEAGLTMEQTYKMLGQVRLSETMDTDQRGGRDRSRCFRPLKDRK